MFLIHHLPGDAITLVESMQVRCRRQLSGRSAYPIKWPRQLRKLCMVVDMEVSPLNVYDWRHLLGDLPGGLQTLQLSSEKNTHGEEGVMLLADFISRTDVMQGMPHMRVRLSCASAYAAEVLRRELEAQSRSGDIRCDVMSEGGRIAHHVW
jgi:hypothetical protein